VRNLGLLAFVFVPLSFGQSSSSSSAGAPAAAPSAQPGVTMQGNTSFAACKVTGPRTTVVRLTISPQGKPVDEVVAVSSGDKCVDRQLLKTVAGYRFHPAMKDGQAVESHVQLQLSYKP
jgi:TonB family protein